MTDLTITLPLSWLSFLTWSGFWAVWLNSGALVLCARFLTLTHGAIKYRKAGLYARQWRNAPAWKVVAYGALWVMTWPLEVFYIARYWSQK